MKSLKKPEHSNTEASQEVGFMKADGKQDKKYLKKSESGIPESAERPVILEKSIFWSRAFLWLIVIMTVSAVAWACLAEIEEAVPAAGKLEPEGAVKDVQAPTGGVVRSIEVKEGQHVNKGDLLVTLDPTAPTADTESLTKSKAALMEENRFLVAQLNNFRLQGSPEVQASADFKLNQQQLLIASRAELQTRIAATQFEISQFQTQLAQAQQQLVAAKSVLEENRGILKQSMAIRDNNAKILENMKTAADSGALSQLQFNQQLQRLQSAESDVLNRRSQIASAAAEVNRLTGEDVRLQAAIAQSREKLSNTISQTAKDILTRIADNQKKISDIDGQLAKAKLTLEYQEIRSPSSGTVFDIHGGTGSVISGANMPQPLMKIVPDSKLSAKVYITNRDIGFIKEGMPAEVKIDSFPSTEFGSVKGKLVNIGSDALPPTQERQFYAFPAKIEMERQTLDINGKKIPLQAGMAVNTSILVRKRSVMTIFLSQFTSKVESLKYVR